MHVHVQGSVLVQGERSSQSMRIVEWPTTQNPAAAHLDEEQLTIRRAFCLQEEPCVSVDSTVVRVESELVCMCAHLTPCSQLQPGVVFLFKQFHAHTDAHTNTHMQVFTDTKTGRQRQPYLPSAAPARRCRACGPS